MPDDRNPSAPLTYPYPAGFDIRSSEAPGTAASLAIRGGAPHVQGARGHFREDRKEVLVEIFPYPGHAEQVSLRACEMAVYSWQHLPKDWTVRCVLARRPMDDPWANRKR